MKLPFDYAEVSRCLLAWYGKEGRDLPWRNTRDPYHIWLSEIMLQQTTVAAVIPYYERFLKRFPSVDSLAVANLDDVIALWAGLGYYSRARNLHKAARMIMEAFAGEFPKTLDDLMSLPGVGRSTAGAILSIAFDQATPILDGNVRRVLVRIFAWPEDPRSSKAEKQLWRWAEALTPDDAPHDYAQAIMDLGATVCTPRQPRCSDCPVASLCSAYKSGQAESLPVRRNKKPIPVRHQVALFVVKDQRLLLRQRPLEGFLGGLWELPALELADHQDPLAAALALRVDLGLSGELKKAVQVKHAYSHFKLELTVFQATSVGDAVSEPTLYRWCAYPEMERTPLHGAHKQALQQILAQNDKLP